MNTYFMHSWSGSNLSWGPFWFLSFGVLGFTLFAALVLAIVILKGYCLWHAAKRDEKGWFIALLLLNTFGILELIYIFFILKKHRHNHMHHEHTH